MSTNTVPAPVVEAGSLATAGHPRRWAILFVVLGAECMDLLDGTIVNVAAPSIRTHLGASASALLWIVGGYALAMAVGLVAGGRLGDAHGRRRTFLAGVGGFTLASLLCGVAPTGGVLIAARMLQGLCAAVMLPQGLGIIRAAFPADELPKAFAAFGPVMGLAAVFGPIAGGVLTDLASWRWVFLVNLPVGAAALAGALRILPESRSPRPPALDWAGVGLVALASGAVVAPLIQGRELGWPAWTFASLAVGVAAFVAFAVHQRRRDRAGEDVLVPPSLLARRPYSAGLVVMSAFFAAMLGLMLVLMLHLQGAERFTPLHAGLTLIPFSLGTAVGAGLSGGLLAPRYGRHVLHAGLAVMVAATLGLLATFSAWPSAASLQLVPALAMFGIGMGLVVAPLFDIILAGVADDEVGAASGVLSTVQQLAGAIGVAVLGTVFFSALPGAGSADALERVLWIVAGLGAVAAALTGLLPRRAREDALH